MPCPRHSSNRVRRLLAAAALVACAARAALVCDAPEHDFGTLPDTDLGVSHTFEVRNTGSDPVVVTSVHTSCDCVAANVTQRSLQPGERVPVDVHFTFGSEDGPLLRAVHLAYRPANAPETAQIHMCTLQLRGAIMPPILRSPSRIDLGTVQPGSAVTGTVSLLSGRCGPFVLRAVGLEAAGARAEYAAGVMGTNHSVRLLIPAPSRSGAFSGLAIANTDLAEMPNVPIYYAGRVAPLFEVRPAFLTVSRGRPLDARLTVSSPYGTPFRILSAAATDPHVSVLVAKGDTAAHLTVTAETLSETFSDALIRIATDHPVCRMIEVPIRVAPRLTEFR